MVKAAAQMVGPTLMWAMLTGLTGDPARRGRMAIITYLRPGVMPAA